MPPHSGDRGRLAGACGCAAALLVAACGGGGGGGGEGPIAAGFEADVPRGDAPLVVRFTDRSRGAVTSWRWDFGDGERSGERNPEHVYALPGNYDVVLTVGGAGGVEDVLSRPGLVEVRERARLRYGINPSFHRWTGREIVFADAMMRASEFLVVRNGEPSTDPAPLIPLGRTPARVGEGWPDLSLLLPGESAGAWLFGAMEGTLPDGRAVPYVLTWQGTGTCSLIGTAVTGEVRRTIRRVEVRVDPSAGNGNGTVALSIDSSSRIDPVRNVHVWLPGASAERPLFWAPYVARLAAMNEGEGPHVLRTLDWTRVNDYGAQDPPLPFTFDLAGVVRPSSPSQGTRRGMCPEFQVALCNALGADLHLSVPHRTEALSEDEYELYLRDTFARIRDGAPAVPGINGDRPFAGLDPSLALTLEFSNETWNAFPVNRWLNQQARAQGTSLHAVIASELVRLWSIADEVFAGRRVVRRFVGGWSAQPDFAARILRELPPGTRIDALGPACYFRPPPSTVARWLEGASGNRCPNCPTPEEVLAAAWLSFDDLRASLRAHRELAESWHNPDGSHPSVELYEAGQSLDAQGAPWGAAAKGAQVLPSMYDAYVNGLIPMLVEEGVSVVNWYSFMTDQDPSHGVGVGFGIWNDMEQDLTLPVTEPYLDEGVPKAAAIYRGPPR